MGNIEGVKTVCYAHSCVISSSWPRRKRHPAMKEAAGSMHSGNIWDQLWVDGGGWRANDCSPRRMHEHITSFVPTNVHTHTHSLSLSLTLSLSLSLSLSLTHSLFLAHSSFSLLALTHKYTHPSPLIVARQRTAHAIPPDGETLMQHVLFFPSPLTIGTRSFSQRLPRWVSLA